MPLPLVISKLVGRDAFSASFKVYQIAFAIISFSTIAFIGFIDRSDLLISQISSVDIAVFSFELYLTVLSALVLGAVLALSVLTGGISKLCLDCEASYRKDFGSQG